MCLPDDGCWNLIDGVLAHFFEVFIRVPWYFSGRTSNEAKQRRIAPKMYDATENSHIGFCRRRDGSYQVGGFDTCHGVDDIQPFLAVKITNFLFGQLHFDG